MSYIALLIDRKFLQIMNGDSIFSFFILFILLVMLNLFILMLYFYTERLEVMFTIDYGCPVIVDYRGAPLRL